MFKATNRQSNQDVVILDPIWADQIEALRTLDQKDQLVCPGCQQPVRVKAGRKRRWHFAHKQLQDCPLSHESAIVLAARAILYQWLVSKFKADQVTLEKKIGGEPLPRPVDGWVETGSQQIAYWLVPSQLKPLQRDQLRQAFEAEEIQINWLFLSEMLREDQDRAGVVYLNTTERALMRSSEYDEYIDRAGNLRSGSSLHYLDPTAETLTTFRSLSRVHAPQLYRGRKRVNQLSTVLVQPKSGEWVHPGEFEALQSSKRQRAQIKEAQAALERNRREYLNHLAVVSEKTVEKQGMEKEDSARGESQAGLCILCGAVKREWGFITVSGKRICRDCYGVD